MTDTQTVFAFVGVIAALALAGHWLAERYRRFMTAPRSNPRVIAAARAWFGFWHSARVIGACVAALAVGGMLAGIWGAVGAVLLVLFVSACAAASHTH